MSKRKYILTPWRLYLTAGSLVALVVSCMLYILGVMSDITRVYMPLVQKVEAINTDAVILHLWFDEAAISSRDHDVQSLRTRLEWIEREARDLFVAGEQSQKTISQFRNLDGKLMRPISHMLDRLQQLHRIVFRQGFAVPDGVVRNRLSLEGDVQAVVDDARSEEELLKRSMSEYLSHAYRTQVALIAACLMLGLAVLIMAMRLGRRRQMDYLAVRETERRLRENQAHLTKAERIAHLGNWNWDILHDRISCSEETYHVFGLKADDFGGNYDSFLKLIHLEDRQRVQQAVEEAVRRHVPYNCNYRVMHPNGEEHTIHAVGVVHLDAQGKAVSMFGTVQDVTEQRHAGEQIQRLAVAVEQADECVVIADSDAIIEYVNPAFERLTGYTAEEVIGKRTSIVKSGEHPEAYYDAMWEVLTAGKRWVGSFINRRKDGTYYEVEQSISPILDDEGRITGFSSIQRDVTEQKQQRSQLEHTQRLEALGVLAGGIAHDFNNILTAIMGNAALAERKIEKSSSAIEHLASVKSAAQRAADLCRQMLAYSGKGKFTPGPMSLSALVEEMAKLLDVSIAKNVTLRLHLADALPAIEADAGQMQQVIMNLVINAAESIGSDSGVVTVSTGVQDVDRQYLSGAYLDDQLPEGRYVYLEISDTGCGMDEETRAKIFDPFFTTKFTGRGLGMSAVLGIVRGHRGTIRVYSEPGKGSTFRVLLPCSDIEMIEEAEEDYAIEGWRGSGTVLVVDDEETIRETARMILEDFGFRVLVAGDGEEGVAIFREHAAEIAAVLLDMTMPKMSGDAAFEKIREIRSDVPVVISSGYSEHEINPRFAGRRVSGFIQKPYGPDVLKRKMHEVLIA